MRTPNLSYQEVNEEMVRRFRAWLTVQNYLQSTISKYCKMCERFCEFIGNRPIRVVTPLDVCDFIGANLPNKWSDCLVNDRLAVLRSFFDFLYLGGAIDNVPPRFIRPRKVNRRLPSVLTQAQVKKLLMRTRRLRDRAILEVFYATGCRMTELLALRVADVDFATRRIRVRGKRKERIVYFGSPAAEALRCYLHGRKDGYLFQIEYVKQHGNVHATHTTWVGSYSVYPSGKRIKQIKYLGMLGRISRRTAEVRFKRHLRTVDLTRPIPDRPMCKHTVWKILSVAARRIGVKFLPVRVLRHTCATHLWENGADIRTIQEILGHSCLSSTQIYVRLANNEVARTFRRVHPRGA
jgi:site-specific recombinase XerD